MVKIQRKNYLHFHLVLYELANSRGRGCEAVTTPNIT